MQDRRYAGVRERERKRGNLSGAAHAPSLSQSIRITRFLEKTTTFRLTDHLLTSLVYSSTPVPFGHFSFPNLRERGGGGRRQEKRV